MNIFFCILHVRRKIKTVFEIFVAKSFQKILECHPKVFKGSSIFLTCFLKRGCNLSQSKMMRIRPFEKKYCRQNIWKIRTRDERNVVWNDIIKRIANPSWHLHCSKLALRRIGFNRLAFQ